MNQVLRKAFLAACLVMAATLLIGCMSQVEVRWTTETEMNTAGFNLLRGESPEGPFDVKVNERLIQPATDPLAGQDYIYIDQTAQPGRDYFYQVQEVEKDGTINTYGPVPVKTGWLQPWHLGVFALLMLVALLLIILNGRRRRGLANKV